MVDGFDLDDAVFRWFIGLAQSTVRSVLRFKTVVVVLYDHQDGVVEKMHSDHGRERSI